MTRINDGLATLTGELVAQAVADTAYNGRVLYHSSALTRYYLTSWLAKAAVETIPDDCFKKAYSWVADPAQISKLEETEKRLKIKQKKRKALEYSRLDGEAYIYFDTGQDATTPLNLNSVRLNGLRFVNVLRKQDIIKGPDITDPMSPFYKEPEYYEVASSADFVRIHPSRVIRFVESPDPDSGEGRSCLVHLLQPILGAEMARDNVVALTTEARIDVMMVKGLMDAVQDPETEAQMIKRYDLVRQLKATNKMIVMDAEGEEYSQKTSSFATLPEVIETMRREVAASMGIPYALLFGQPGGMGNNGEMEMSNYYDSIKTMQENEIQPICEPLDECVIRSALGSRPEEVHMVWNSLWEMSDKERAEIGKLIADTAGVLADKQIIPADVMTESTVNALTENGSFPGLEQQYAEWVAAGGPEEMDNDADELPGDNDLNQGQ